MKSENRKVLSLFLAVSLALSCAATVVNGNRSTAQVKDVYIEDTTANEGKWSSIYFGRYWQDDTNGDGIADEQDEKEAIQWRVLSRDGNYALLLADRNLDAGQFHSGSECTWATSDIRKWLNSTFLQTAFTTAEQSAIYDYTVETVGDDFVQGLTTETTVDKVFLLSYQEVCFGRGYNYGFSGYNYNDSTNTRIAGNTAYTATKPGMYASTECADTWWLRSTGTEETYAYYVLANGWISVWYSKVNEIAGIRPAIYVDLSDTSLWTAGAAITAADFPLEEAAINPTPTLAVPPSASPVVTGTKSESSEQTAGGTSASPAVSPAVAKTSQTSSKSSSVGTSASSYTEQTIKTGVSRVARVSGVKVKNKGSASVRITWKKVSGAGGYNVQIAGNRTFTKGKKSRRIRSGRITLKVKKGKTYYARVRAYKKSGGKTTYGAWSVVKKIRVKK